jgi:membrane protein implicated in regulation of membrane protease activity
MLDFVINTVLVIGFVMTILTIFVNNKLLAWFPAIASYYRLIQVLSVAVFLLGVYLKGGYTTEMAWRERVSEVEAKLKKAEQESASENVRIDTKIVTRTQVVREKGQEVIRYVDREIVKYDIKFAPGGQCEIPEEFIKAHNDAAEAPQK